MNRIHFTGVVHPERANVSLGLRDLAITGPPPGVARLSITASQVHLTFETDHDLPDAASLRNSFEALVQHFLDCLGFIEGCGYGVDLRQLIYDDGENVTVFGVHYDALLARTECPSFEDVVYASEGPSGAFLTRALSDVSNAIGRPQDTLFHCYRALESIMQYFLAAHPQGGREGAWETMRAQLSLDRADIMRLKGAADPVRHGLMLPVEAADRDSALLLVSVAIERFVPFLLQLRANDGAA